MTIQQDKMWLYSFLKQNMLILEEIKGFSMDKRTLLQDSIFVDLKYFFMGSVHWMYARMDRLTYSCNFYPDINIYGNVAKRYISGLHQPPPQVSVLVKKLRYLRVKKKTFAGIYP